MPVHPTAVLHDGAEIGGDVEIGPYSVIGPEVKLGARCRVGSHVVIDGRTTLGDDCHVFHGSSVGSIPQDLKFQGEETCLIIGEKTVIREFATISIGTVASGQTTIGKNCFLMAYSHVAHDCQVGDNVIISNAGTLAGHVTVYEWAHVGALTPVHQFCRVGRHAYIGGGSRVIKDVIPFSLSAGNPLRMGGLNMIGLKRHGFTQEVLDPLKKAYRLIFIADLTLKAALEKIDRDLPRIPEVKELTEFVTSTERGFHR